VLPASQRTYRESWRAHKDLAAKALKKLAGRHVPASMRQLERAVERIHAAYHAAVEARCDGNQENTAGTDGTGASVA
jgi:hypothetical protein